MNDTKIEAAVRHTSERYDNYFENPEEFIDLDIIEFSDAARASGIASWAQRKEIQSDYSTAKKIIESIN